MAPVKLENQALEASSNGNGHPEHGRSLLTADWEQLIPEEPREIYKQVISEAYRRGVPFALGGAFAVANYKGQWRDTKDLDLYVTPRDVEPMKQALAEVGLTDYYEVNPYERHWIYRSHKGSIIVDVIWAMANRRTEVDELWLTRGPEIEFGGRKIRVIPVEEMIWSKIYVVQRDRCDWPDILNVIHMSRESLDWRHLLDRMGDDWPLLAGVMDLFRWVCPKDSQHVPAWVWRELNKPVRKYSGKGPKRVDLIDTRPWFRPGLVVE